MLAASWWNSTGAVVVLTGAVAVGTQIASNFLRPWLERGRESRARLADWRDSVKELCIDGEEQLKRMDRETFIGSPGASVALSTWDHGMRRTTRLLARFAPDDLRPLGDAVLTTMETLHVRALDLVFLKRDSQDSDAIASAESAYDAAHTEATKALDRFERSIGGP